MTANGRNGSHGSSTPRVPGKDSMAPPLPKRFYATAAVGDGGPQEYAILLDDRRAKTPKKSDLVLPTRSLAEAVAAEWLVQGDRIDPARMPLTRLANTAIDGVSGHEASVRADIVKYAGSDLLCYRAERPEGLVQRQARHWDPVLAWMTNRHNVHLTVATGLVHVAQPPALGEVVAGLVAPFDAFRLTALHVITTLSGSTLLALAIHVRHLTAEAAWTAAHVDEDWQIEEWGADTKSTARRQHRWNEMRTACDLLDMLAD